MLANKVSLVQQMSTRVRNFTRKGDYKWNWSCDVCGDSAKDQRKARFYVGRKDGDLLCHCHNCGFSGSIISYFKQQHPDLAKQLVQDDFLAKAPSLFDHNDIIDKLPDDILVHVYYISQYPDGKQWARVLKDKKVEISGKNLTKLVKLHRKFRIT